MRIILRCLAWLVLLGPTLALAQTNTPPVAIADLQTRVANGDAAAMVALGDRYRLGEGVPHSNQQAAALYRKAATLNHPVAMTNLANLLMEGWGIPKNVPEALSWYRKAAALGNRSAIFSLGAIYYNGDGVPKNVSEGILWFQKGADLGDPGSKSALETSLLEQERATGNPAYRCENRGQKFDEEDAFQNCDRLVQSKSTPPSLRVQGLIWRARMHARNDSWTQATADLNLAVSSAPSPALHDLALRTRAELLTRQGKADLAAKDIAAANQLGVVLLPSAIRAPTSDTQSFAANRPASGGNVGTATVSPSTTAQVRPPKPQPREPRIALVIGNSAYDPSLGRLANAGNDATAMANALTAVGFKVEMIANADQRALKRAIAAFGQRLRAAGPTATGLFFYAGHGVQARGTNYLVPIGAPITSEADVDLESVAADTVLMQMEQAGSAINIVILDACRNLPVARSFRDATRGLARVEAPRGSYIAYSTAPGSVASDGSGTNSPYVAALTQEIRKPGQSIEETFKKVRLAVLQATGGKQMPWDSSSLITNFSFAQ